MKICCISDIHGQYSQIKLPKADILIIAGDLTNSFWGNNYLAELVELNNWLTKTKKKFDKILFVAGNHDICIYENKELFKSMLVKDVIYLENSGIELDDLYVYGSPICPTFNEWAYMANRGRDIARYWAAIPGYTNILITHTPPQFILDQVGGNGWNLGCHDLADRVKQLNELKLHVFGHIHTGGVSGNIVEQNGAQFVNASLLDEYYSKEFSHTIIEL